MLNRRQFLQASALAAAAPELLLAQDRGPRPAQAADVKILNPRARVPVSLLVDDSTCLVNLAHFCIPQFAHCSPDRYTQDWRKLPREIPDAFVRKFSEWCREHGVKGKYSVIPYPACVGWIDRGIPGWTHKELDESLRLLRDFMAQDWDFTPEMVTHTRMIDPKTGKPQPEFSWNFMENSWTSGKKLDQLTEYVGYALQALKNAGLDAQGVTSPGGFGGKSLPEYSQAVLAACREVFKTEIPFYLKKVYTDDRSVVPEVLYASGLETSDPKCVVSVIGCTDDWFGGWDGLVAGSPDKMITEDLQSGRLTRVIAKGEPAVLVSHWPGHYFNGEEHGFKVLQTVVKRLHARYDNLLWMKFSEISRYWAARELTRVENRESRIAFRAPFACPAFTIQTAARPDASPKLSAQGNPVPLRQVDGTLRLESGTWTRVKDGLAVCFDLPKGPSLLEIG